MSATRRLFVGIALRDGERRALAGVAAELQRCGFAARYEDEHKLHLTLAFLGNVPHAHCAHMAETLRGAVAGVAQFEIVLDKVAAFPHERKPRVAYAGARDQGAAYRSLARSLRAAYADQGFVFDADPVAHVTLARVKSPSRPLPMLEFAPIVICVDGVRLFESVFDKGANTSRYDTLSSIPLAGASVT